VTRLRAGRPGLNPGKGNGGILLFATASRPVRGPTEPNIQRVAGDLTTGVKWSGREADYSPPYSAEVKNSWNYTSTPSVSLHGVVLNKAKHTSSWRDA
jgi:hypothetical protein